MMSETFTRTSFCRDGVERIVGQEVDAFDDGVLGGDQSGSDFGDVIAQVVGRATWRAARSIGG